MPLGVSAPSLALGVLVGLSVSFWGAAPAPAPVPSAAGFAAPLCPAASGWGPLAAAGAFLLGGALSLGLVLCGACAVFGAGALWNRQRELHFAGPAARVRPIALPDITIRGEPTGWR